MKKIIAIFLVLIVIFTITNCDEENPVTQSDPGNIYLESTPAGAQIWVDGVNSNKVTPDTLTALDAGNYSITLKFADYFDSTFTVTVNEGQTTSRSVTLTSNLFLTFYGQTPIRIFETAGTTASQPSGLDLSSGDAFGVSGTDKDKVDVYYSSSGYLVQSAHLNTTNGLTRRTYFRVSSNTNLNDGVDSPLRSSGTWNESIGDREAPNYVFLYDEDGHYTKLLIEGWGGGSGPGDPAYLDIQWWYNETTDDVRF